MGDSFDINFKPLPPSLQMHLWLLALDADTSRVNLAYSPGNWMTGLAYNYGGNAEAFLSIRRFSTTLGINPSNGNMNLGLVYRGFRFGASGNISQQSAGLNFGYGAALLPMPAELASTFNTGAASLRNVVGDIGSAPGNPLAWYGLHSNDLSAIGRAVGLGRQISEAGRGDRFGVGLRLNYTPQSGLLIYGGAQFLF
ncbi:MAG: hypothetical protein ABJF23_24610 [Bryobacteraceae bacterium]